MGDTEYSVICTSHKESYNGQVRCPMNIPNYKENGHECNLSFQQFHNSTYMSNKTLVNGSCINWNKHYTICEPVGLNPMQGGVSFDNCGSALIAIFQVRSLFFIDEKMIFFGQSLS